MAYNNQVDKTVAGILSHTAKDKSFIQRIILFISQTSPVTSLPSQVPTKGIHENAIKAISAYKIIADSGTAIRLDIKNKFGNW